MSNLMANEQPQPPTFDVYIDPGNASEEMLVELFSALSAVNIACGGPGLRFDAEDVLKAEDK